MQTKHIAMLIGASALSILALIGFQVNWLRHSRQLLEEQFNNKVRMALCATVDQIAEDQACCQQVRACCVDPNAGPNAAAFFAEIPQTEQMLTEALARYQINLPYRVQIVPNDSNATAVACGSNNTPQYYSSLMPVTENDSHLLKLELEGKTGYLLNKMGLMIAASIAILCLICVVFGLATYYLVRQYKMSQLNRDFFNHMTHEFRTPLTNIKLAGNMLARKQPELRDNRYLGIIQQEAQQLMQHAEGVLRLAALEKGDYRLKQEPLDLGQVLDEVVASMDLQIKEKSASVQWQCSQTPCQAKGDAFHLANAFRNLLDNALKYNAGAPSVQIEVTPVDKNWRVSFQDNGVGVPEQHRRSIFKKFRRVANPACPSGGGFGLGLAYVKKIVDMHHGSIQVSCAEGQGSRFDLYLPKVS